jgi:hypothetical protein
MTARTRTKCSGCGRRIPAGEPDLVLRKFGSERRRFYHQRCLEAAERVAMSSPDLWVLTNRYVQGEMN